MQTAYGNLQLFTSALQGVMADNQEPMSKQVSNNNARIKECMSALMDQLLALQDILTGATVCGYSCLDTFHCRVFEGRRINPLREEIVSLIGKVCHSSPLTSLIFLIDVHSILSPALLLNAVP